MLSSTTIDFYKCIFPWRGGRILTCLLSRRSGSLKTAAPQSSTIHSISSTINTHTRTQSLATKSEVNSPWSHESVVTELHLYLHPCYPRVYKQIYFKLIWSEDSNGKPFKLIRAPYLIINYQNYYWLLTYIYQLITQSSKKQAKIVTVFAVTCNMREVRKTTCSI